MHDFSHSSAKNKTIYYYNKKIYILIYTYNKVHVKHRYKVRGRVALKSTSSRKMRKDAREKRKLEQRKRPGASSHIVLNVKTHLPRSLT